MKKEKQKQKKKPMKKKEKLCSSAVCVCVWFTRRDEQGHSVHLGRILEADGVAVLKAGQPADLHHSLRKSAKL